jgi:NADH-quinone oxidoreductase subunit N
MIQIPEINLVSILPALIISGGGVAALMVGVVLRRSSLMWATLISLFAVVAALVQNSLLKGARESAFAGMIAVDNFCFFLNIVILLAAGLTVLMSVRYLSDDGLDIYEYFVLILFAAAGMMFMVSGNHLLVIFLGLETLSISIYVLSGLRGGNPKSQEAALKYLLLGAFSSGIFLYGAALLYGAAGTVSLPGLAAYFKAGQPGLMAKAGMGLLLVGFGFKVAAAPFHMWTPDVYEGAPTPLTGFMSVGVKAAAFAAFVRVFFVAFESVQVNWSLILWVFAVLTMIVGNIAALAQENIKRMLAYSSIAHAGYLIVGMIPAHQYNGLSALLYYLLAYTLTNMGAFGVVALVGRKGEANVMIDDYRGLAKTHPALAVSMAIFLFSLAGLPPTAGFIAKFTIFGAAIKAGYIWLVVIGVLTSAASVYYYFRVVMKMYMEAPEAEHQGYQFCPAMVSALVISVVGVLYLGLFPGAYLNLAVESIKPLF